MPTGVDVEVVERAGAGQVVRRLGGAVDDQVGPGVLDRAGASPARSRMSSAWCSNLPAGRLEAPQVPGRVALGAEEVGPHVVVDPVDLRPAAVEVADRLGPDQAAAPGDDAHEVVETLSVKIRLAARHLQGVELEVE